MGNTVFLAAGSGGDLTSMTTEEREQVIKTVCEVADGKVPVMASAQSTDVRVCIELCQFGETVGLDAVQLSGPYYYDGRPGDVLAAIRSYVYKSFAFPSFMGKALASPSALPVLFLVPIAILLGCVLLFAPTTADGSFLFMQAGQPIDFNIFPKFSPNCMLELQPKPS